MEDLQEELSGNSLSPTSERDQLQEQNRILRARLVETRRRRRRVEELWKRQQSLYSSLEEQDNAAVRRQEQALLDFQSALSQRLSAESLLQLSYQWNATNDCFHISHEGPFATINGLRLGAQVETTATTTQGKSSSSPPGTAGATPVKVPWHEINSALGQVALLLATLAERPYCGIRYRHEIVPMGSTSKMGIRRGGSGVGGHHTSVSLYNLYSDDSFQFFGRRNFNTALECLLECVLDASEAIQKRDRTITLPHAIVDKKIGGLPVVYSQDGEWTRAMKYLLTDIKHLMAFRGLALWDS